MVLGLATVALVWMGLVPLFFDRRSPDERAIEDTVDAFVGAVGHDGDTACLQLSREAQTQLMRRRGASSCQRAAESSAPADTSSFDFHAIRFAPDDKRARVPTKRDEFGVPERFACLGRRSLPSCSIPLEEGDGRWRITTLEWYFAQ